MPCYALQPAFAQTNENAPAEETQQTGKAPGPGRETPAVSVHALPGTLLLQYVSKFTGIDAPLAR